MALVAIIVNACSVYALASGIGELFELAAFSEEHRFFDLDRFAYVLAIVFGLTAAGMIIEYRFYRQGGQEVAASIIAEDPIDEHSPALYQPLRRIVEEMAMAAGTPAPKAWVLPEEPGINACALGYWPEDAAILVSQGAVEWLDDDELRAVIAHEFSHILNRDAALKLYLRAILGATDLIWDIGSDLYRWSHQMSEDDENGAGAFLAFVELAAGCFLIVTGAPGHVVLKLTRNHLNRQRELIADAAAVQFTRYHLGILGALKKVGGWQFGSHIGGRASLKLRGLFFADDQHENFGGLRSSHPALDRRIRALEPDWDGDMFVPETPVLKRG